MGEFCLVVKFYQQGSAFNGASPSSYNVDTAMMMMMANLFLEISEIGRMSSVDLKVTPLFGPLGSKSSSSSMLELFLKSSPTSGPPPTSLHGEKLLI